MILYRGLDNQYVGQAGRDIRRGMWYVEITGVTVEESVWRLSQRTRIDDFVRLRLEPRAQSQIPTD